MQNECWQQVLRGDFTQSTRGLALWLQREGLVEVVVKANKYSMSSWSMESNNCDQRQWKFGCGNQQGKYGSPIVTNFMFMPEAENRCSGGPKLSA